MSSSRRIARSQVRGACLCGAVAFALAGPTDFCAHCHCTSCRRASGAAFLTWTSVPVERFAWTSGARDITWHHSSNTIEWGFCRHCGTTMLYRAIEPGHPESPKLDRMYVTVGCLLDPLDREPSAHVSFEEHVAWFEPGDALPKHLGKAATQVPTPSANLILYVADQAAATQFWAAALAAAPTLEVPGMTEFALPGGTVLGLMPGAGAQRLLPGIDPGDASIARAELYLRVADPEAAHARALAAGATELSPMADRDWGDRAAYCRDPDGHVLAFAQRRA